ncbi:hypothetical protein GNI_124290 [Gregarina niphandrodes]|uniref:Uncharacterized protein n=1 Tax=Gregarina niphandrodes TaxID=110365 RepID=A0A023B2P8_GRENI|nr:hypothetical protein GNI_124290 [Gregarina niphandrodes]EZG51520.1 hypothetical protein GNI_124290 [Gregarina niphandrodes]|eukprot:XP_011131958.1 hypothetical protein GNI_124290 [Gregarina niphandrodes]
MRSVTGLGHGGCSTSWLACLFRSEEGILVPARIDGEPLESRDIVVEIDSGLPAVCLKAYFPKKVKNPPCYPKEILGGAVKFSFEHVVPAAVVPVKAGMAVVKPIIALVNAHTIAAGHELTADNRNVRKEAVLRIFGNNNEYGCIIRDLVTSGKDEQWDDHPQGLGRLRARRIRDM